jgi:hypothetical protein
MRDAPVFYRNGEGIPLPRALPPFCSVEGRFPAKRLTSVMPKLAFPFVAFDKANGDQLALESPT